MHAGSREALIAFAVATTLATCAACTVPALVARGSRASRVVIATLAWNVLIIVPVYALGLTNTLYPGRLATFVSLASVGILALAAVRLGVRAAALELRRTAATFLRLPFDAFSLALRERSFVAFGVVVASGFWVWTTAQAVLAPTWGDWDCLWYHEPMIGFAIQNHGFQVVPLEPFSQKINGYPRLTEMTMLWFGIFHGRWAIDLLNPIVLPMLAAATYQFTFDLGRDRVLAIGWASVVVTLPGVIRIVPTILVDVHALALVVAALAFALRREFRLADAWISAFAIALSLGSKTIMLVPGGLVCLVVVVRLVAGATRLGRGRAWLSVLGFSLVVAAPLAATYLRNYLNFHNPIWPDIAVRIPSLGIDWPGNYTGFDDPSVPGPDQIPHAFKDQFKRLYQYPFMPVEGHAWQIADYGLGFAWALIPAWLLAMFLLPIDAIVAVYRHIRSRTEPTEFGELRATAYRIVFVLVPCLVLIPAFHIGRYHLVSLVLAAGLVSWVGLRFGARRLVESVVGFMILGNVMTIAWNDRGWLRSPFLLADMARTPIPARFHQEAFFSPDHLDAAIARERQLGRGKVIVFERIGYLSLLWNDHYSNRVEWLEEIPDPRIGARRRNATWIYAGRGSWFDMRAAEPNSGWTRVATLESEGFGNVYRRTRARAPRRTDP